MGEVVESITNGTTKKQHKEPSGIPVTRIETISDGVLDLTRVGYLRGLSDSEIEKWRLRNGDLLFSHINSDMHLGKTALFGSHITVIHGMNLLLIRVKKGVLSPKYLHYLSNHYRFSGVFVSIAQHAVNQSSINQAKLKTLPIPLPHLHEQHRIVSRIEEFFSKLDAGVKSLQTVKAQLKRYKQSVLNSAFEGKLTGEWRRMHKYELEPASKVLIMIQQERLNKWEKEQRTNGKRPRYRKHRVPTQPPPETLPMLPEHWAWTRLGTIVDILPGQHILSKDYGMNPDGFPYITGPEDFGPIHPIISKWTHKPKVIANPGSVLVTVKGAGVGKVNMMPDRNISIGRQLMSLTTLGGIPANYLFYFLCFSLRTMQESSSGTTVPGLKTDDISELLIPLAPLAEQLYVVHEIQEALARIDVVERAVEDGLRRSKALVQSILAKAFRGELVPQDHSDEPASVLRERFGIPKTANSERHKMSGKDSQVLLRERY